MDLAFRGHPGIYYPKARKEDILYNFCPDLEAGYLNTAGSCFHLYSDQKRWAIVFEISGYNNRAGRAYISLLYFGNFIKYKIETVGNYTYFSNFKDIELISGEEFERIRNIEGTEADDFEIISPKANFLRIRDKVVPIEQNFHKYEEKGIKVREWGNPRNLIGYADLVRYLNETEPGLIRATENEIKEQLFEELPKLMVIKDFHHTTIYSHDNPPPSSLETYQLMAKVLATGDISYWKPTLKPNNDWRNWESGHL